VWQRHQLGARFRKEREALIQLLAAIEAPGSHPLEPGLELLRQRSRQLRPVLAELEALEVAGRLSSSRHQIAMGQVHMHLNRMLRADPRRHELVLYDFLSRHYASHAARRAGARFTDAVLRASPFPTRPDRRHSR
jgi:thiopeptide-type bacteriocin biosynthesis protein